MKMFFILRKDTGYKYLDLETMKLVDIDGFSERCLIPTEWLAEQVIETRLDGNYFVHPVVIEESFADGSMAFDFTAPDAWKDFTEFEVK